MGFAAPNKLTDFSHAFCVGFRMMSAKEGVCLVVEHCDFGARVGKQFIEVTAPGAVHEFYGNP